MDATALNDYRRCPELHRRRHIQHLVPEHRSRGAAEFGIAIHDGLKPWFDDAGFAVVLEAARASWGPDPLFPTGKVKYTTEFLAAVLEGYAEAWPRADDNFDVVRNEQWVEQIINLHKSGRFVTESALKSSSKICMDDTVFVPWGAVLDRQITVRDEGGIYPMDTKTTSLYFGRYAKSGIEHIDTFQLDTQIMGQVGLLKVEGKDVVGAILDCVHLDTRGHKVKPEHFLRDKVLFEDEQISQWARDVEWTIREIERLKAERGTEALWPKHDKRCFDYFRPCEYRRLCLGGDPLDNGGFKHEIWEPHKRGAE